MNEYFIVNQDLRDQNYHAFNLKNEQYLESKDYNSRNTNQLNVDEIIELLKNRKWIYKLSKLYIKVFNNFFKKY